MEYIFIGLGVYLVLGLIVLVIFDLLTHNIRDRLMIASEQTRDKMMATGNYYSPRMAMIITLLALWVFWIIAIFSALFSKKG